MRAAPPLRVRRLRNLHRIPASVADPQEVGARLDRLAGGLLRDALAALVPGLLERLGLSPSAEVVLGRLELDLQVGVEAKQADVAAVWAAALLEAAERAVAELREGRGGELPWIGERAAVFSDRAAAEATFLARRSRGEETWWARPLLADAGRVPEPEELVLRRLEETPERAPAFLLDVAMQAPGAWSRLLAPPALRRVAARFTAGRERPSARKDADAGAPRSAPPGLPTALPDDAGSPEVEEAARRVGAEAGPRLRLALRGEEREEARALLAGAAMLHARPSATAATASAAAARILWEAAGQGRAAPDRSAVAPRPGLAAEPDRTPTGQGTGGARGGAVARTERPSGGPEAGPSVGRPRPDEVRTSGPPAPGDAWELERLHPAPRPGGEAVRAGGLLFLLAPLLRDPEVAALELVALERHLLAFAREALGRAFAPLGREGCRAAVAAEAPLLRVFTGLEVLPPEGAVAEEGPAARARLDALSSRIPRDLGFAPRALVEVFGSAGPRWADADRPLAALLLRPGRLFLTRTHADLQLALDSVDVPLRAGAWDLDPGWLPPVGRVLRFTYVENP